MCFYWEFYGSNIPLTVTIATRNRTCGFVADNIVLFVSGLLVLYDAYMVEVDVFKCIKFYRV